jgi:hypothetical protein
MRKTSWINYRVFAFANIFLQLIFISLSVLSSPSSSITITITLTSLIIIITTLATAYPKKIFGINLISIRTGLFIIFILNILSGFYPYIFNFTGVRALLLSSIFIPFASFLLIIFTKLDENE